MKSTPFGMPPFDPNQFDPSKMDPQVLMRLSALIRQLPPDKLNRMQSLMHNMMAGIDVSREMEEFEKSLPTGFREKLMGAFGQAAGTSQTTSSPEAPEVIETNGRTLSQSESTEMNLKEARLTILRAVANGEMTPQEAEKLLFP